MKRTIFLLSAISLLAVACQSEQPGNYNCDNGILRGQQSRDVTVPAGKTCYLEGFVSFKSGTTFRAQPGARIYAYKYKMNYDGTPALSGGALVPAHTALYILQGAKIEAIGTATEPVSFESYVVNTAGAQQPSAPGDWGGINIYGYAPMPLKTDGGSSDDITGFAYGGGKRTNPEDDSGTLRYVKIAHGGMLYFDPGSFSKNLISELVDEHAKNKWLVNSTECLTLGVCEFTQESRELLARRIFRYFSPYYGQAYENISTQLQTPMGKFIGAGDTDKLAKCQNRYSGIPTEDFAHCTAIYGAFADAFPQLDTVGFTAPNTVPITEQVRNRQVRNGLENFDNLNLSAVGSQTTVEYVHTYKSGDDGIKVNGGTVNLRYIVTSANKADQIEFKNGYKGKVQHLIAFVKAADPEYGTAFSVSDSANVEMWNVTLLGDGVKYDEIAKIKQDAIVKMSNVYVANFKDNTFDLLGASVLDSLDSGETYLKAALLQENKGDKKYPYLQKGRIYLHEKLDGTNDSNVGNNLICEETDTTVIQTDTNKAVYDSKKYRCFAICDNNLIQKQFSSPGTCPANQTAAEALLDSSDYTVAVSGNLNSGNNVFETTADYLSAYDGTTFKPGTPETGLTPSGSFFDSSANYVGAVGNTDWTSGWINTVY